MAPLRKTDWYTVGRVFSAIVLSFSLLVSPLWAAPAPSASFGTIVFADRAHVGAAQASVGGTVFDGDRLSTEASGSVQVRAGAARLLLSSASSATLSEDDANPSARLAAGSATFSTANSKAFTLHALTAAVRPTNNQPTVGVVSVVSAKELIVKCTRGSVTIAVEDDVREIPEGSAYRIVLDPNADPQGPRGAGTKGYGGPPIKAAKSKFIWYAIAISAAVTIIVAHQIFESSDRP